MLSYTLYYYIGKLDVCKGCNQLATMKRLTQGFAFVYIQDALQKGACDILVSTVDTNVIFILVGVYFTVYECEHVWV